MNDFKLGSWQTNNEAHVQVCVEKKKEMPIGPYEELDVSVKNATQSWFASKKEDHYKIHIPTHLITEKKALELCYGFLTKAKQIDQKSINGLQKQIDKLANQELSPDGKIPRLGKYKNIYVLPGSQSSSTDDHFPELTGRTTPPKEEIQHERPISPPREERSKTPSPNSRSPTPRDLKKIVSFSNIEMGPNVSPTDGSEKPTLLKSVLKKTPSPTSMEAPPSIVRTPSPVRPARPLTPPVRESRTAEFDAIEKTETLGDVRTQRPKRHVRPPTVRSSQEAAAQPGSPTAQAKSPVKESPRSSPSLKDKRASYDAKFTPITEEEPDEARVKSRSPSPQPKDPVAEKMVKIGARNMLNVVNDQSKSIAVQIAERKAARLANEAMQAQNGGTTATPQAENLTFAEKMRRLREKADGAS